MSEENCTSNHDKFIEVVEVIISKQTCMRIIPTYIFYFTCNLNIHFQSSTSSHIKHEPKLEIIDVIKFEDEPCQSTSIDGINLQNSDKVYEKQNISHDLDDKKKKTSKGRWSTRYVKKEDGLLHCNFCDHKGRNKPGMSVHFKVVRIILVKTFITYIHDECSYFFRNI